MSEDNSIVLGRLVGRFDQVLVSLIVRDRAYYVYVVSNSAHRFNDIRAAREYYKEQVIKFL